MRREIELWIGAVRADLGDDSFVLMNYTMEDLANPAVVRNSFSKQITLPGTTLNNRIFGEIFRNDRVTQYGGASETGIYFDPCRKTTWRIYNGQSELLDSGYLHLDGVTRKRNTVVEYKVTLYGGLGSFLYGLAYDGNGEKRTLASLDYRGTNTPATEFNFTLNAAAVRAAWTRIAQATGTPSDKWDFINFAPAYNGKPTGTFDAGKGVMDMAAAGIDTPVGSTVDGLALVTLAQEYTEWETKDLRSYLQRPVVRLRSIIEAACASRNNGGWTVTLDPEFFADTNPYWQKTWMTLPIIDTDNIITDGGGSGDLSFRTVSGALEATVPNGGDTSKSYTVSINITPFAQLQAQASGTLYLHCSENGTNWMNYVQYTINAYDSGNHLVAQTAVRVSSRQPAAEAGDVPQMDAVNTFYASIDQIATWDGATLSATLTANGIKKVRISASSALITWGVESQNTPSEMDMWTNTGDLGSLVEASRYTADTTGSTYSYSIISGGRSGKPITKAVLLSGGGTPADYLVSLCKMFGLVMVADGATKTVSIEKRSTFYRNEVVDITDRIDMDTGFDKKPYYFDAKWYVWAAHYENGEWAKMYAEKYGATFGQMRVDTGYSFDAAANRVLDSVIFRGAVMALENAKYYCRVTEGGRSFSPVLLDRGAKYGVSGGEQDLNMPTAGATITWMNSVFPSYDLFPKAQFHDKENAPFDERDTLLFFDGVYDMGGGYVDQYLPWQAAEHPLSYRTYKYISIPVKEGDRITVRLTDYSVWSFCGPVMGDKKWSSTNVITDTGWLTTDLSKVINATEDGYYFRIAIKKVDGGDFTAAEAEAAILEASATRSVYRDSSPYTLTDDTQAMLTFNNGTPCWLLNWSSRDETATAPDLPKFSRYIELAEQHQGYIYSHTLDFGTPAEVPIPGVTFWQGATIWPDYFEKYIADRYDDDSAVVHCKVNLAGMQVGADLMRRFYWFDGAVWALNKIINHSVTTDDLTECEFVKVQDVDNYTT